MVVLIFKKKLKLLIIKWDLVCFVLRFCPVLLVGGNYSNNDNAGLWYWNLNNSSSNTNSNLGARHLNFHDINIGI